MKTSLAALLLLCFFRTAYAQTTTPVYLQVRSVPHGTVKSVAYKSKSLGTDRKVVFSQQLSQHKVEHFFRVTGGAHTFAVWQRNLNDVAPMLFAE